MVLNAFLVLFAVVVFAFFFILLWSIKSTASKINEIKQSQTENKALTLMQQQIGQLTQNINQQLQNMSSQFQETTGHIGTTLGSVKQDLGKMEEVTRDVLEKAKSISNLENLLRAPKFRGGLSEFFLGDLLAQILPPAHYSLQYKFKSGEIDAKFPLENFKRHLAEEDKKIKEDMKKKFVSDVKKHINEIEKKYILPDEGTYNFALMYIPAENIYYETILKDESLGEDRSIFSYAIKKRVIPVSPNSFFAYLQVIVMGLKGLQIEKSAQIIFQSLTQLQGDLNRFKNDFQVLGTHLNNAKTKFDDSEKRLDRFSGRLERVSGDQTEQLPKGQKTEEKDS